MRVLIELRPEDAASPKVQATLTANAWVNHPGTFIYETTIGWQFEAMNQNYAARQVLEPFLDLGVKFRRAWTRTIPMSTVIASIAREVSREHPDIANDLYDVIDTL